MDSFQKDLILSVQQMKSGSAARVTIIHSPDTNKDITAPAKRPSLDVLRSACNQGLLDIEQGRCVRVSDDELDSFIDRIGAEAAKSDE